MNLYPDKVAVARRRRGSARAAGAKAGAGNGGATEAPPLRAELFSVSQLEQHARQLAAWHEVGPADRTDDRLLSGLAANQVELREAYDFISEAVKLGRRITPAAEWFIDNYHLVEEQIRTARRHLPRGFNRELPRLASGPAAGSPRVHELAI